MHFSQSKTQSQVGIICGQNNDTQAIRQILYALVSSWDHNFLNGQFSLQLLVILFADKFLTASYVKHNLEYQTPELCLGLAQSWLNPIMSLLQSGPNISSYESSKHRYDNHVSYISTIGSGLYEYLLLLLLYKKDSIDGSQCI